MGERRKEGLGGKVIYQAEGRRNQKRILKPRAQQWQTGSFRNLYVMYVWTLREREKKMQYDGIIASFLNAGSQISINYNIWPFIFMSTKPSFQLLECQYWSITWVRLCLTVRSIYDQMHIIKYGFHKWTWYWHKTSFLKNKASF